MIKDTDTKKYWSLSWAPTIDLKYDKYECRHGMGYTKISTIINKIEGEILYFVPRDLNAEIWRVKLANRSEKKREFEIYSFQELMMGNALNDIINQPNDKHFTEIKYNKNYQALTATRRYWVLNKKVSVAQPNIDWGYNVVFTHTLDVTGFDGSLDKFIGRWRSESNPEAVESGKMGNTEITAGDPIVALQSKITLDPNESIEFAVILAVVPKEKNPFTSIKLKQLKDIRVIDSKFKQLNEYWDNYLSKVSVCTPDNKFNTMLNVWNQYQAAVTFDMARNSGYYHGGLLFGTGMRDQFQDILGMVIVHPDKVRKRLLNALRFQFKNGSTLHNYFKITESGEKTNHSDTPLWIPFGIMEYLKETGDFSILDEKVTYYDGGNDTVYNHMKGALDFSLGATTNRGMPKIMNGDWNDTLDHVGPRGKGETVWGAFFLAYVLRKSFDLFRYKNDKKSLVKYQEAYNNLDKVVNKYCWDGNWYLRAFRDNGIPIGSSKDNQGKIFLNAQSWSVISGLAPKEKADSALNNSLKYLLTPYGMQITSPSFTKVDDTVGLISRCVPGKKENGAVFNHASSWFVLASIMNGDIDNAYEVYSRMLPINSSHDIDKYETEPYVFAEYVTSPDHETQNQASHSWLTGTAVWMYRIGLDYILGFQTELHGIRIYPSIPQHWEEFSAVRLFRGKKIILNVSNKNKSYKGIKNILINKKVVNTNFIDITNYKEKTIKVDIELE